MLTVPRLLATPVLGTKHFFCHGFKKPAAVFCASLLEQSSTEEDVLPKMAVLLQSLLGLIVIHAALLRVGSLVFKSNLGIRGGNRSVKGRGQDIPWQREDGD